MNNYGAIVYNQPHLLSKILYKFKGLSTPSCIAFYKAIEKEEIIVCPEFDFLINFNEKTVKKPKQLNEKLFWLIDSKDIEIIYHF